MQALLIFKSCGGPRESWVAEPNEDDLNFIPCLTIFLNSSMKATSQVPQTGCSSHFPFSCRENLYNRLAKGWCCLAKT